MSSEQKIFLFRGRPFRIPLDTRRTIVFARKEMARRRTPGVIPIKSICVSRARKNQCEGGKGEGAGAGGKYRIILEQIPLCLDDRKNGKQGGEIYTSCEKCGSYGDSLYLHET